MPILLKDNIYTNDRTNTTAGSYAFLGARKAEEGTIVTRLREAGAILLGKTNLSEWANFRSTNATGGWSARGGQTLGAFVKKQASGGSSSGSAVAISLGLATISLGTDVRLVTHLNRCTSNFNRLMAAFRIRHRGLMLWGSEPPLDSLREME